jgi:hypothetical protein
MRSSEHVEVQRIRQFNSFDATRRSRGTHAQKLRGKDRAAGKAVGEGHQPPGRIDKHLRLDEPDVATTGAQLAASRGEDVLHPVGVRPVRQREHVVVPAPEPEDRDR